MPPFRLSKEDTGSSLGLVLGASAAASASAAVGLPETPAGMGGSLCNR